MAFTRPTITAIRDRVEADLDTNITNATAPLRRSTLKVFGKILTGLSHLLHGRIDNLSKQVFPDTADADNLARWASIWGVQRKLAVAATGTTEATGTNGVNIPTGTVLRNSDGEEFTTDSLQIIVDGAATLPITASVAGLAGNVLTGAILTMISPIAGVDTDTIVDAPGIAGGLDGELDESLRARLLFRIQSPPHGGTADDYERWALEVSGVTRAFYFSQPVGLGTVGLSFVMDDKTIPPDFVTNGSFTDGTTLVNNGGFDVDAFWTFSTPPWSIGGGLLTCDGSQGADTESYQLLNEYIAGRIYSITYTISGFTGGNVKPMLGVSGTIGTARSTNGTFTDEILVPSDKPNRLTFIGNPAFSGSIDNVSVIDRGLSDWQTETGWSVSSGVASCDGSQVSVSELRQVMAHFTVGATYKITFTVSNYSSGSVRPILGVSGTSGTLRSADGTYVESLVVAGNNMIILEADSSFVGDIDNVKVEDENSTIIPGALEIQTVVDHINDGRRPVTAELFVTAMDAVAVDFTIQLKSADTAEIRTAVTNNLTDLLFREGDRAGTLLLSHIKEAISSSEGEVDHVLVSPTADVTVGAGEIHEMGTITWI